jgi:hypothetical protein
VCTYIVETAKVAGSAKGAQGWFPVDQVTVAYDHPSHAPVEHALMIDFTDASGELGRRVGVELSLAAAEDFARALLAAVDRASRYEGRAQLQVT